MLLDNTCTNGGNELKCVDNVKDLSIIEDSKLKFGPTHDKADKTNSIMGTNNNNI